MTSNFEKQKVKVKQKKEEADEILDGLFHSSANLNRLTNIQDSKVVSHSRDTMNTRQNTRQNTLSQLGLFKQ
jgi:hypothetical protein